MKFYLNKELTLARENACILYTPQTMQHYEAVQKFRNSYIHFSCSDTLIERFKIPLNSIFILEIPMKSMSTSESFRKNGSHPAHLRRKKEYFLLNEMFIAIARAMAGENTDIVENRELYEIFLSLRLDMLRSYEKPWTTEDLCRRANLEKSQFFACYQKFFQSTPHADLLSVRLEKRKICLRMRRFQLTWRHGNVDFPISPTFPGILKNAGVLPRSTPADGKKIVCHRIRIFKSAAAKRLRPGAAFSPEKRTAPAVLPRNRISRWEFTASMAAAAPFAIPLHASASAGISGRTTAAATTAAMQRRNGTKPLPRIVFLHAHAASRSRF